MASTFTWLDYSDRERQKMLAAIAQFKETEPRDELGLGAYRDAFAELLFPGTSTVQTRAAYFLFVPWMYQQLDGRQVDSAQVAAKARKEEVRLRDALMRDAQESHDDVGLLGKQAGASLKRLPSNVYWNGLGVWRIRRLDTTQEAYHRSFSDLHNRRVARDNDNELVLGSPRAAWDPNLPGPPARFPDNAQLALRRGDAAYLRDRITSSKPDSLLALLVKRLEVPAIAYAWLHPHLGSFPAPMRRDILHARKLAEVMHGAALLYNLMLAEQLPAGEMRDATVDGFQGQLRDWVEELRSPDADPSTWDRAAFWARMNDLTAPRPHAHDFVERWYGLRPWSSLEATTSVTARTLVTNRERELKHARARLGNTRAMERWTGASGAGRMDFRWNSAKRLLEDIEAGLSQEADLARTG